MGTTKQETLGFQAEITQLLDLMIHSLYSNKDIFLRELISNAADAIDRLRFAALSDPSLLQDDTAYAIHVSFDAKARTITVRDNGIGMSRQEVIEHIGTIAKSGTREFFQSLTGDQQHDAQLIGQFGVGFYSSFVVADRVALTTHRADLPAEESVRWESDGKGSYSITPVFKLTRGTEVELHVREGEDELLDDARLRGIIHRYSEHIAIPIYMQRASEEEKDQEEEQVNKASALWTRPRQEITSEEYTSLYQSISHDFDSPLSTIHSRMEGTHEYTLLLFIPRQAPLNLWNFEQPHGVKLYVRRVFIMDDAEQLLPRYLRFIRGVVDSNDLPLNVSREILQQNRLVESMKSTIIKKVLGALADMANEQPEDYATFWAAFGRVLKEGLVEDNTNRETIAKLARFVSTKSEEKVNVSLEDYIGRMPEGQKKIYYLHAEQLATAQESPLLEIFHQKGIEVLLFTDPVDAFLEIHLPEFQGISFQSVARGSIDLAELPETQGETEKEPVQSSNIDTNSLIERLQKALADQVQSVRLSSRLINSSACLVASEYDMDPTLQRLLQASGQKMPKTKPILEINPNHPLIARINQESDDTMFADWASVLYDQAVLSRGEQLEHPARFVQRLNDLLAQIS
jgi:molecular chaperone HtpG